MMEYDLVFDWRKYLGVFEVVDKNHMIGGGLEPGFVFHNHSNLLLTDEVERETLWPDFRRRVWSSWEGVRLRNQAWLKTIRTFREKYPDALFIVYAGVGHVLYSETYSLGNALAGAKTLVVNLYPPQSVVRLSLEELGEPYDLFDVATDEQFIHDRLVQFADPALSRLFGADVRWCVPEAPEALLGDYPLADW